MKQFLQALLVSGSLTAAGVSAADAALSSREQFEQEVEAIKAEYAPRIAAISAEAEDLGKDMPSDEELLINIDLDEMELVEWKLHVPEVHVKLQTWKLHVPEIHSRLKTWRFHTPSTRMRYHRFPWGGGMDVPEFFMQERVVKLHVPEVHMKLHTWKLHVPEIHSRLQTWKFHIPKISVGAPRNEVQASKAEADKLKTEAQVLAERMKSDIAAATRDYLNSLKTETVQKFDIALDQIRIALKNAPNDIIRRDLKKQQEDIVRARADALRKLDTSIAKLN